MRVPKRQNETHQSCLLTPAEYAKCFVCFCHILNLKSVSPGGNGQYVDGDLGANRAGEVGEAEKPGSVFDISSQSDAFPECLFCV